MAEMNQFGSVLAGSAQACGRCEALLMDVLDGVASAADQKFFDAHATSCAGCTQMLADARRGGAWLEMLRDPRPEPPAALFERILAQTSGLAVAAPVPATESDNIYSFPAAAAARHSTPSGGASILLFRIKETFHRVRLTMLQPRLAMTAAMAFFSIALTLNLTGVHVSELRMGDLRPSNLRRSFYEANAHVVRYCDNLRVVYELEARTHDLRSAESDDQPASSAPSSSAPAKGSDNQPTDPGDKPKSSAKPGPGTSRRETAPADRQMVAANEILSTRALILPVSTLNQKGDPA